MEAKLHQLPPVIAPHLLWEYDLTTFDFERSKFIVIERVIERGSLKDWRAVFQAYGDSALLEVIAKSKQLSDRDKAFTRIFIHSPLLYAA